MKKCCVVAAVLIFSAMAAVATAGPLAWQTTPILGNGYSTATGDLVMFTGPAPTTGSGDPYFDVDGNVVLGPTIPHYSIAGDPLFGVGSPSMTDYYINPTAWDGSHLYDPDVWVYSGSGVYLDPQASYHYRGVFSFLGTPGNPAYDVVSAEDFNFQEASGFIMLIAGVGNFWPEDVGHWIYTETWIQNVATGAAGDRIAASVEFDVRPVPEPATLTLLGLGLAGVARMARRKK